MELLKLGLIFVISEVQAQRTTSQVPNTWGG